MVQDTSHQRTPQSASAEMKGAKSNEGYGAMVDGDSGDDVVNDGLREDGFEEVMKPSTSES